MICWCGIGEEDDHEKMGEALDDYIVSCISEWNIRLPT
jgi:hypothetical protein